MDDLIAVILTLIIAGAGALGQIKKKKQMPVATEEPKNPENIWELFREENLIPELKTEPDYTEIVEDESVLYKYEQPESIPYDNEQDYKFEANNEGGTIINQELVSNPITTKGISKKKEKFPLRKAVIYSEILNRKYT
jgi:hypothetical protein